VVIKPFRGRGGHGVIKVSNRYQENLNSLTNYYIRPAKPYSQRSPIMVQKYLNKVETDSDVRILLLNGEIIGSMSIKLLLGNFGTNGHGNSRAEKHVVTPAQKKFENT